MVVISDASTATTHSACFDDPLYLSNNESISLSLVSTKFDGTELEIYDYMVLKWISNSLIHEIKETVEFATSAKEIWSYLLERYGQMHSIEIYQLHKELSGISQEANAYASARQPDLGQGHFKEAKTEDNASQAVVKICSHCKNEGHLVETCHKLMTCSHYGKKCHIKDYCFDFRALNSAQFSSTTPDDNSPLDFYDEASPPVADASNHSDIPSSSTSGAASLPSNLNPALVQGILPTSHVNIAHTQSNMFTWIVDTGASDHMTSNEYLLIDIRLLHYPLHIGLPDGTIKIVHKAGKLRLNAHIILHNVLIVPDFKENLLSVEKLLKTTNLVVHFTEKACYFQDLSHKVSHAEARKIAGLYRLIISSEDLKSHNKDCVSTNVASSFSYTANKTSVELLHARLGHTSKDKLCHAYEIINGFLKFVQTQFNTCIKVVRSDRGSEFVQDVCGTLFADKDIMHQKSVVGRPQHNGRVERKHRHLVETARALRIHVGLPIKFWGDSILTATFLINKMPTPILHWKSPFKILLKEKPSYNDLRVFGSLYYVSQPVTFRDKFGTKARSSGSPASVHTDMPVRQSVRPRQSSIRLNSYECPKNLLKSVIPTTTTSQSSSASFNATVLQSLHEYGESYIASLNNVFNTLEPSTYEKASIAP
ncbi:uncharacterized protein LOC141641259 [Silene latifolia]|uniref:uncharacterized protein LOC141641259 n=1 Tax=Silene latifolia TaxID=37657 RepID=UPI003D77FE1A